jgi:hypothetical protein
MRAAASDTVAASLVYKGITQIEVPDGQPVTRGQTIGWITREEHSQVVALKLLMQYRVSGKVIPPPDNLPALDLGLEIFELKWTGYHRARPGGGPPLSTLRSRKLSADRLRTVIRKGGAPMPAFETILSSEEEKALIEFLAPKRLTIAQSGR